MIKNITTKLSEKNIFFIKIFQAFANNNNVMDKDLFNYFIQYTDKVTYDTTEIDYNGLYDLINIARANGDELLIDNEQPIKSGNIALVYNGRLNGKRIIVKYRRKNIEIKFKRSMEELQILINITKHVLVPQHIILTNSEKKELVQKYSLKKESQLACQECNTNS